MSGFFARRDEVLARNGYARTEKVDDSSCPALCEALHGQWDENTHCYSGPPYKLSLWMEGTLVKVCLGAGEGHPKWFWSFKGLDAGLEQIEAALNSGAGDWVEPKPTKLGLSRSS